MTDFTIIGDKKYIKIASPDSLCGGCSFLGNWSCEFPTDAKGFSSRQCSNPSVVYREYKEPEQPASLTKAEVIAAIYSETPLECSLELPVSKQSYFAPYFLLNQTPDLDEKVVVYLLQYNHGFVWRYKKVLSITTRKFLQGGSGNDFLINIWSTNWETPQEEIPSVIKSFIRWLEEPQTTTHEI